MNDHLAKQGGADTTVVTFNTLTNNKGEYQGIQIDWISYPKQKIKFKTTLIHCPKIPSF